MKNIVRFLLILLTIISCSRTPDEPQYAGTFGEGALILNEGNFQAGNGSLSFYSYDSLKIYNDLFQTINGRPLGDVPNSIVTNSDKVYIVVNNSGKIEVLNRITLKSTGTINGLISPRNIAIVSSDKAYISSLYSDSLAIINISDYSISGYIALRRSSEAITVSDNKAYISNWLGGNEIMVVNTLNDKIIDSIKVGNEPESMVLDRSGALWVLCNGGWSRENYAKLVQINTNTNVIAAEFTFPTKLESPSCLKIDAIGQTLYFIDNGVRKMDIYAGKLPETAFISEAGRSFYKIEINPSNDDIFITDAGDYMQQGYVLLYRNDGSLISNQRAGIIPGSISFINLSISSTNI